MCTKGRDAILGLRLFHNSTGVLGTDFEGTKFRRYIAVVGAFFGRIRLPPAVMGWAVSCDDEP